MTIAADILLGIAVACAWLGAAGFLALRSDYDRLHCLGFVTATAGFCIALAVFLTHPFTAVAVKAVLLYIVSLLSGAVLVHATARAMLVREGDTAGSTEEDAP